MITSAEEFVRLRNSDEIELYTRAAHDSAPEEVWLDVIHRYPEMKKLVAHNKTVPHSILRILATDTDSDVRSMVARKRKAEWAILEALANDPCESVRTAIATNKKTPAYILQRLADDPCEYIAKVARKRLAPES
jgi:hypothetical protein